MVATFLMGTRRLYDFVDDNPAVNMFPVSYVNDPSVIGQNDSVVAINSADPGRPDGPGRRRHDGRA